MPTAWRAPRSWSSNIGNRRSRRRRRSPLLRLLKDCAESAERLELDHRFHRQAAGRHRRSRGGSRDLRLRAANAGRPMDAIAKLEALIELRGRRRSASGCSADATSGCSRRRRRRLKAVYLNKAIDAYERGMELDLNQYYCSGNLPRLYPPAEAQGRRRAGAVGVHDRRRRLRESRRSATSRTNGCGRRCSAPPSTQATPTRRRSSPRRSGSKARRAGNSRRRCPISSRASCWSRTRLVGNGWRPFSGHSKPQPHKDEPPNRQGNRI